MSGPHQYLVLLIVGFALLLSGCGEGERREPTETLPLEELYAEAQRALKNGNYERCVRYNQRLVARFPFGRTSEQATLDLAFCQYKSRKPEEALATANRFIRTYPAHPNVDYAYYVKGLTNFERDRGLLERYVNVDPAVRDLTFARQSFDDFGELVRRYPTSSYVADARQRMLYVLELLARHELAVGTFYYERGAYVAAVGRAQTILTTMPQSSQVAPALSLLARSYDSLGKPELAADARRVLRLNHPSHPEVTPKRERSLWRVLWPFGGGDEEPSDDA